MDQELVRDQMIESVELALDDILDRREREEDALHNLPSTSTCPYFIEAMGRLEDKFDTIFDI